MRAAPLPTSVVLASSAAAAAATTASGGQGGAAGRRALVHASLASASAVGRKGRHLTGTFCLTGDTMEGIIQCLVFLKAFSVSRIQEDVVLFTRAVPYCPFPPTFFPIVVLLRIQWLFWFCLFRCFLGWSAEIWLFTDLSTGRGGWRCCCVVVVPGQYVLPTKEKILKEFRGRSEFPCVCRWKWKDVSIKWYLFGIGSN